MMHKHIVIEGPDGSGKDTLIDQLRAMRPGYQLHPRASTSLGGPVDDLVGWVQADLDHLVYDAPEGYIYNRHPLISEFIYAPYRPGKGQPHISATDRYLLTRRLVPHVVVVLCQPPLETVIDTVQRQGANAHMPGVHANIAKIAMDYRELVWPGRCIRYDYTTDSPADLITLIRSML